MEQTIEKRIAAKRKDLAMTQDQLAELVGVRMNQNVPSREKRLGTYFSISEIQLQIIFLDPAPFS